MVRHDFMKRRDYCNGGRGDKGEWLTKWINYIEQFDSRAVTKTVRLHTDGVKVVTVNVYWTATKIAYLRSVIKVGVKPTAEIVKFNMT